MSWQGRSSTRTGAYFRGSRATLPAPAEARKNAQNSARELWGSFERRKRENEHCIEYLRRLQYTGELDDYSTCNYEPSEVVDRTGSAYATCRVVRVGVVAGLMCRRRLKG